MQADPPTRALHALLAQHIPTSPSPEGLDGQIQDLLARGAGLNHPTVQDNAPAYPLALAIRYGHPLWVRYLLDNRASVMVDPPPDPVLDPQAIPDRPAFHPLGIVLDRLCEQMEAQDAATLLAHPGHPDREMLEMVLAARPDVLEADPWKKNHFEPDCEMPLLRWADHLLALEEEFVDGLSDDQLHVASLVLGALFARTPKHFQDRVERAWKAGSMQDEKDTVVTRFCQMLAGCPRVARAWWATRQSDRLDKSLPAPPPSPASPGRRF